MIWTHGLQHTRLSCPSLFPWAYSNSCPLRWWCYLTISSPAFPFSYPQSFPTSGYFSMSWLFASGSQRIGASASVLPMTIQGWFPLRLTGLIALQSKRLKSLLQHHWRNKIISSSALSLHYGPTLTSIHDYWKNHSFDYMDVCWQSNISIFQYAA